MTAKTKDSKQTTRPRSTPIAVQVAKITFWSAILVAVITGLFSLIIILIDTPKEVEVVITPGVQTTVMSVADASTHFCKDDNLLSNQCSKAIPIYTPGRSSLTPEPVMSGLEVVFSNNSERSGLAIQFISPVEVGEFNHIELRGTSTEAFQFVVEYKVKLASGAVEVVSNSEWMTFPQSSTVTSVQVPLHYSGTVDEIGLNFVELGESSKLALESVHLVK